MYEKKPIAFMLHQGDNNFTSIDILNHLKQYPIGDYVIARETDPYVHYHLFIEMDEADYNAFIQKVVRKQWKLRGRALTDKPKQYGKVKEIKKRDKMLAYTLKQGVYISSYSEDYLQPFKDLAFTKDRATTDRDFKKRVLESLDEEFESMLTGSDFAFTDKFILKAIIKYHLKNNLEIRTKSYLDGILRYTRQFSTIPKIRIEESEYYYLMLYGNF
jgi:hypothetical protein